MAPSSNTIIPEISILVNVEAVFARSEATEVEAEDSGVRGCFLGYGHGAAGESSHHESLMMITFDTNLTDPEPSPLNVHTADLALIPFISHKVDMEEVGLIPATAEPTRPARNPTAATGSSSSGRPNWRLSTADLIIIGRFIN